MKNNIKLLDGSMAYPLELDGYNLNNRLWTGDALVNNPELIKNCLLYTSPSPRDRTRSRMPSSA